MKLSAIVTFVAFGLGAGENWTPLKPDEQIVFYPSVAQRVAGNTNLWRTEIRGCVFESEKRRLLVAAFGEAMELKTDELTSAESAVFGERARLFLVDHERGKEVFIRLGTNEFFVGKSGADGRFAGAITFPESTSTRFTAVLTPDDTREITGRFFPLETEGVSVISDIDDTIKITEVRDRQATLRNTFLRNFQPVPDMAEFYEALARSPLTPSDGERVAEGRVRGRLENENAPNAHAAFHYVSASPWQLYQPLAAFAAANGFPAGTFELKEFRWKDRSFFSLFDRPEQYKPGVIEPLLKQFPRRKFILIGDSGERDPEIYGELARKYSEQIIHIYIRDVSKASGDAARYQEAFHNVPRERWQVFREPGEVQFPKAR
jgi:phosphatidate phosphatase APP1